MNYLNYSRTVVLRFKTRILVVETYYVDGISYLGAHVMLSIVNDHLSNKWMEKKIVKPST